MITDSEFLRLVKRIKELETAPPIIERISGEMLLWPGSAAPTGWLMCDGSAVSRATYAALFAVVGTTYGAGDGSTTFNVPNLKGRVAVGKDAAQAEFDVLGETGGTKTGSFGLSAGYAKLATVGGAGVGLYAEDGFDIGAGNAYTASHKGAVDNTVTSGFRYATHLGGETDSGSLVQPYIVLNYIIKT